MSSPHILVVTEDEHGDQEYAIECPGVTESCMLWHDCTACDTRTADSDEDLVTAHGVEHRRFSWDWLVASGQCFNAWSPTLPDAVESLGVLEPGRYPVKCEIEDESYLVLSLITEAATR